MIATKTASTQNTIEEGIRCIGFPIAVATVEKLFDTHLPTTLEFREFEKEKGAHIVAKLEYKDNSAEVQLSLPTITTFYPMEPGIAAEFDIGHELAHYYLSKIIDGYIEQRSGRNLALCVLEEGICDAVGLYVSTKIFYGVDASVQQIADTLATPVMRNTESTASDIVRYLDGKEEVSRQLRELAHMNFADAINELVRRIAEGSLSFTRQFSEQVAPTFTSLLREDVPA